MISVTTAAVIVGAALGLAPPSRGGGIEVQESWDVGKVPSGFPVRFCLLTAGSSQYVGYYDARRRMTVASRRLGSGTWQRRVLPSTVGWDSHNYITMAVDGDGHLHVSGNMHCVPLVYFRTGRPGDITTLKWAVMTGEREDKVTYPRFLTDPRGTMLFTYRNGGSGNGVRLWNKYDTATGTWSRLLDTPLLDGEGERNAYPLGPVRGPGGWYHLAWVWRDTPDCATNHHLSHARSRDLVRWESVFGDAVRLPMVLGEDTLWVDPVPSGGGIINGCQKLFFDRANRPIITYHRSDAQGNMQIYAARPEGGKWVHHVLTDWRTPVAFGGRGSMSFIGIRISGLCRPEPGVLTMTYRHRDHGSGRLVLDEETLRPLDRTVHVPAAWPAELARVRSDFPGMTIRRAEDSGEAPDPRVRYVLQWETLGPNQDRPRTPPLPEPGTLRVYKLAAGDEE